MYVKWHNKLSHEQHLNRGGPQGSIFGILEYLVKSNKNANCLECSERFKFVDDLTILTTTTTTTTTILENIPCS